MSHQLVVHDLHQRPCSVWTIDFETYYDTKRHYTLGGKQGSTVEYIRDSRFKAHGAAVVDPSGQIFWVSHQDLPSFFKSIDWTQAAFCAHNAAFDGLIAYEHYGVEAAYYIDTLSMARGLFGPGVSNSLSAVAQRFKLGDKIKDVLSTVDGIEDIELYPEIKEELVKYALQDVKLCRAIFEKMYFDEGYPTPEMHIIDQTIRLFVLPKLEVDAQVCLEEIQAEEQRMARLSSPEILSGVQLSEHCIKVLAKRGVLGVLRSTPCFVELLRARGVEPPKKLRIKNGEVLDEETFALAKTDAEFQQLAKDPRVADLVEAWTSLKSTIRKTRAQRLLAVTHHGQKPLPIPLNYCGGRTHRWSGGGGDDGMRNPYNPQNLVANRSAQSQSRLREAIRAPKGYRLIIVDSAQIEARFVAWVANEHELLADFKEGRDPYSKLAEAIFGVPVSKHGPNKHLRHIGKEGELSLGYGVGWQKFYQTVKNKYGLEVQNFTEIDAQRTVNIYRQRRQGVVTMWRQLDQLLRMMINKQCGRGIDFGIFRFKNDRVLMPNELPILYPELSYAQNQKTNQIEYVYKFKDQWVKIYAAKMFENLIQSVARTAVAQQALMVAKELPLVLLVHDEVVALAPESEADQALQFAIECLSSPLPWCEGMPFAAEGVHSECYTK